VPDDPPSPSDGRVDADLAESGPQDTSGERAEELGRRCAGEPTVQAGDETQKQPETSRVSHGFLLDMPVTQDGEKNIKIEYHNYIILSRVVARCC